MDRFQQIRVLEALLFAASEPLDAKTLSARLPEGADLAALLEELSGMYDNRGVNLVRIGDGWGFRTAKDLSEHLRLENSVVRKLSRAAIETLAIIAYHQPITRAEIEEIRGVALSKGTLDILLEASWVRPRGRRRAPGRPVTWGTSTAFLDHFGIESLDDLPGIEELKATGLLERRPGFGPLSALREGPYEDGDGEQDDMEDTGEDEEDRALADLDQSELFALDEAWDEPKDKRG